MFGCVGRLKFAGRSVEQCRVSLHLRPQLVSSFPCKIILTIVIEVMILDFKYFISKLYKRSSPFSFFFAPPTLNWILFHPFRFYLFPIYRTHIISRYTDNNGGTLIFQYPESIIVSVFFPLSTRYIQMDISFLRIPIEFRAKIFFLFFFFPPRIIFPLFATLTSSIA